MKAIYRCLYYQIKHINYFLVTLFYLCLFIFFIKAPTIVPNWNFDEAVEAEAAELLRNAMKGLGNVFSSVQYVE